jgi:hypothetical protein
MSKVALSQLFLFRFIMPTKSIIELWASYLLQGQYSMPFPFPDSEKLALFYNLNFSDLFINLAKYVIHYLNFMSNLFI